ncbi:MAG: hypothetical protein NC314_03380 [Roseburia sp.]|nr:hypothetical protein [Roseburia sp.]MCM1241856.1 hypothetical protein [Roseburia sp.]
MDNMMNFSYMTRLCHNLVKGYQTPQAMGGAGFYDKLLEKSAGDIAKGNGQRIFNEKAKDSFWERRKKRRQEWLELLEELEEKKAVSRRMARSQYFAELSAIEPEEGVTKEVPNCDALAMQIFSTFKANILLESFQGKKG